MFQKPPLSIMFSAGESSGDQHAANMFLELKKHQPDIKGFGMGAQKWLWQVSIFDMILALLV